MTSLGNQDFRKFIDESKAAAVQKKQKPKKKKDRAALHKKPEEEDPDAPKYRCSYHHVRVKYKTFGAYVDFCQILYESTAPFCLLWSGEAWTCIAGTIRSPCGV